VEDAIDEIHATHFVSWQHEATTAFNSDILAADVQRPRRSGIRSVSDDRNRTGSADGHSLERGKRLQNDDHGVAQQVP
jgi:hypothetical protein